MNKSNFYIPLLLLGISSCSNQLNPEDIKPEEITDLCDCHEKFWSIIDVSTKLTENYSTRKEVDDNKELSTTIEKYYQKSHAILVKCEDLEHELHQIDHDKAEIYEMGCEIMDKISSEEGRKTIKALEKKTVFDF